MNIRIEPLAVPTSATANRRVAADPFVADITRMLLTFFSVVAIDVVVVSLMTHRLRFWFPLWLDPQWATRPAPWVVYSQSYFAGIFMIPLLCRLVDRDFVELNNLQPEDVTLFIPHQANKRIIDATAKRLAFPEDKVYVNVDRFGNTSSASIPIALDEANRAGKVKKGDLLLLDAFGGGLTWGAVPVRWQLDTPIAP